MSMYKWRIEFVLNSGKVLVGMLRGSEDNSNDVAKKILEGQPNEFIGIAGIDETHNLLVKKGEIVAVDISVY